MNTELQAKVDELKVLEAKATPGPWETSWDWLEVVRDELYTAWGQGPDHRGATFRFVADLAKDDAAYIAAACNLAPTLIAALEQAQAELDALREADRWIPIRERLPIDEFEQTGSVVYKCTVINYGQSKQAKFYKDRDGEYKFFNPFDGFGDFSMQGVTHWRPLPQPPEMEKK